jgi:hypothetical protein
MASGRRVLPWYFIVSTALTARHIRYEVEGQAGVRLWQEKAPHRWGASRQGPAVGIEIAAHALSAEIERYDQCYETNYLQR